MWRCYMCDARPANGWRLPFAAARLPRRPICVLRRSAARVHRGRVCRRPPWRRSAHHRGCRAVTAVLRSHCRPSGAVLRPPPCWQMRHSGAWCRPGSCRRTTRTSGAARTLGARWARAVFASCAFAATPRRPRPHCRGDREGVVNPTSVAGAGCNGGPDPLPPGRGVRGHIRPSYAGAHAPRARDPRAGGGRRGASCPAPRSDP